MTLVAPVSKNHRPLPTWNKFADFLEIRNKSASEQIPAEQIRGLEQIRCDNGLSGYIREKCKLRIVSHEKAAADLREFKETARCSVSALERVRGPLKRPKSTSSQLGVSPDTARETKMQDVQKEARL